MNRKPKPGTSLEQAAQVHGLMLAGDSAATERVRRTIRDDPWGPTARAVEYAATAMPDTPGPVTQRWTRVIDAAREDATVADRQEVARILSAAVKRTGLPHRHFATRVGTTPSRFSTYVQGKATPSATFLIRAQRIAEALAADASRRPVRHDRKSSPNRHEGNRLGKA